LFHVFNDEDRRCYVEGLATVLKPGCLLFLMCFSQIAKCPGASRDCRDVFLAEYKSIVPIVTVLWWERMLPPLRSSAGESILVRSRASG
jgi:hypothetical protein